MISDSYALDVMRHAAAQTRRGEVIGATRTLIAAWAACLVGPGPEPLVQGAAVLCADALKRLMDLTAAPGPDAFFAMRLSTSDGRVVSFEDAAKDPAELAALRCVSATLNDDRGLLSSVLGAYIGTHGIHRTLDVVAELLNYYLAFEPHGEGSAT